MSSVRRSTTVFLVSAVAVGSLALTGCSTAKDAASSAVSSAAGAASSAAAAALDKASQTQLDSALGDMNNADVKTKICDQFKSNADTAYNSVVEAANSKQAGAGDMLKKAVSLDQFSSYLTQKCA